MSKPALLLLAVLSALAQQPSFEVASIKPMDPNPSNPLFIGMSNDAGMVHYTNITLRDCIRGAYRIQDFQIAGPDWLEKNRYEINAKLPAGVSTNQIPEMLQTLLAERFKLELRREMKEQNVYALLRGRDGTRLKPADMKKRPDVISLGPDGKPRPLMMYRMAATGVTITAPVAQFASLTGLLSRFTARPVVDMTGIEGEFDFELAFYPESTRSLPNGALPSGDENAASDPAPSLSVAFQKYGLQLEARRAPIEMFTVMHAEKTPTAN
jgi:uncharacterized protein (TIGR03435 family)